MFLVSLMSLWVRFALCSIKTGPQLNGVESFALLLKTAYQWQYKVLKALAFSRRMRLSFLPFSVTVSFRAQQTRSPITEWFKNHLTQQKTAEKKSPVYFGRSMHA